MSISPCADSDEVPLRPARPLGALALRGRPHDPEQSSSTWRPSSGSTSSRSPTTTVLKQLPVLSRIAQGYALLFVPGVEVAIQDGSHILCYFRRFDEAMAFDRDLGSHPRQNARKPGSKRRTGPDGR
ncbi:MAG: hypothetical protein MZU97_14465 [Bacillus subtilis]|nr:hypothetical protein [Bacillus subtilis]